MTQTNTRPAEAGVLRSALIGVIFGVDAAGHCLALATILFAGALAAGLGLATAVFLLATAVGTAVMFRFGGFRITLAITQDTTIAILAPAVALAVLGVSGPLEAKLATAFAVIGASAVLSGAAFWAVGRLGLGRLVRMFPYPVAAGFLASSGYLLVFAALSVLTDARDLAGITVAMNRPEVLYSLVPAALMAACLVVALRIWRGATPVLVVIFVFLGGFYLVTFSLVIGRDEAVAMGLLPAPGLPDGLRPSLGLLGLVDWGRVALAAPTLAAVVLLNLIGLLLNTSGVELATREDVDENRELRVAGLANIGIGLFGGLTSYMQSGATIISTKLGVRPVPLVVGHFATLLAACGLAGYIVAAVPTFIPAGLLMFIGLSMLEDWLVGTRRQLILLDWLIVVCIVAVTAFLGILPAIGVGLLLAMAGFAYASLRMPVIRTVSDASQRRSILDRSASDNALLQREGHRIRIVHLQGALFFGSVEQLIGSLRGMAASGRGINALIVDLSEVNTFDSSACAALGKLWHVMRTQGITPHLTGVAPPLQEVFVRWGLPLAEGEAGDSGIGFRHWRGLDDALEYCETALLTALHGPGHPRDLAGILAAHGAGHPRIGELIARMERIDLVPGDVLIAAAGASEDVFFLETGRLGVHLPGADGTGLRVRSMGPGAIVGEIAYLTAAPRGADVICERPARAYRLSGDTMGEIEAADRDLAALLATILARSLAEKLVQTNTLLAYWRRA